MSQSAYDKAKEAVEKFDAAQQEIDTLRVFLSELNQYASSPRSLVIAVASGLIPSNTLPLSSNAALKAFFTKAIADALESRIGMLERTRDSIKF